MNTLPDDVLSCAELIAVPFVVPPYCALAGHSA